MAALLPDNLALEDFYEDILGKAQRGRGWSDEELAARAGLTADAVRALKQPPADEAALARVAPALGLHGPSLLASARKNWRPPALALAGLAQVNLEWRGGIFVNAFVVWDPATRRAALFDTGVDAAPLLAVARAERLTVELIFITHTHPDHIAALAQLRAALPAARVCASRRAGLANAEALDDGARLALGALRVETRRTTGHAADGVTYVVEGLAQPVAVVGDALFAGSMGGAKSTEGWAEALQNNRAQIFTLPDNTVLCPGHGPLTTVGQEKAHNPFYPEFKNTP